MEFTTTLTHSETAQAETLRGGIIHDIRLENAVYHTETGRFGPDSREHLHQSETGKILTNLFQLGTALVVSHDGAVFASVSARNASRAAAAVAIRNIRNGGKPIHGFDVSMRNKSGAAHNETIWFGFDHIAYRDETVGDERSELVEIELSLDEIWKLSSNETLDVDGWQERNWPE